MSPRFYAAILSIVACAGTAHTEAAGGLDELRVSQLEQDVRELQNEVRQQARRIDTLEDALRRTSSSVTPAPRAIAKNNDVTPSWLASTNWDKLRNGMPEFDVVAILGPPTTTRESGDKNVRTLFYALELEGGGFLSGQVVVSEQRVVEVRKPVLK